MVFVFSIISFFLTILNLTLDASSQKNTGESTRASLTLMEAVSLTLQNQLDIQLAIEQMEYQGGVLQASAGPFDPTLEGVETYSDLINVQDIFQPIKTHFNGYQTEFIASIRKKTRLGSSCSLDVNVANVSNPVVYPYFYHRSSRLAFSVQQPLLQGFVYGLDAMTERSNQFLVAASYFDCLQEISQRVLNTTIAYWEMVAAKKTRDALQKTVKDFIDLYDRIQILTDEEEMAKGDIVQAIARLSKRKVDLAAAEQEFYRTFENLKFTMNIVEKRPCAKETIFSTDDFIIEDFSLEKFEKIQCPLLELAAAQRYDILASQTREQAIAFLVKGAQNGLLPSFNFIANVIRSNFHGYRPSVVFPRGRDKGPAEVDVTFGFNISVPFNNDAAKGLLRQFLAQQSQVKIRTNQIIQQSLQDLRTALSDQITLAKNVKEIEVTVSNDLQLTLNETEKLNAGYSPFNTLFFLINFEDTYTNDLILKIEIEKRYLQNIARIRFLSATLFNSGDTFDTVDLTSLSSLHFQFPCQ